MAQASDVSSGDENMRSSHRALLNQSLKAPIEREPPSSLPNWENKEFRASTRCVFSTSDMRSLFNHLDLMRIAREQGYEVGYIAWSDPSTKMSRVLREPARSVRLIFADRERNVSFDVHCFLAEDATEIRILASRKVDPKYIVLRERVMIECDGQAELDRRIESGKSYTTHPRP